MPATDKEKVAWTCQWSQLMRRSPCLSSILWMPQSAEVKSGVCGQVLDGAAYHTHLDNVQRLRKGTLQVSLPHEISS